MRGPSRASGLTVAVLAVPVLAGLAACSGRPGPGGNDSNPPSSPPTPPPQSASRQPSPQPVTVRGTVARGVEPNCLVLATGEREYLLLRPGPEARPGAEVVVRGTVRPGLPTTCMQGTPLVVDAVDPVGGGAT